MDAIFASIDASPVLPFLILTGVVIVGIALALKGISLAKRAINKA